jgi:hypothetical protein
MIVQRYYAGWSFERIGSFSFAVTSDADGKSYTATMSTGSYYHGLLADTGVGLDHSAFATAFATALNAAADAAASGADYTVTWSNVTLRYTITCDMAFSANLNTIAQRILGMAGSITVAGGGDLSEVGTRQPYYVIVPAIRGTSDNSGDVHVRGQIRSAITDGGKQFGVGPTSRAMVHRWMQRHESRDATFRKDAEENDAWAYQHLFEHCGVWEPFLTAVDATTAALTVGTNKTSRVMKLLGADADFAPSPTFANWDDKWDIPFSAVVLYRWYGGS